MSPRMRVLAAAVLCAILVGLCVAFIDRPVETFVNAHRRFRLVYQAMAAPSLLPLPFSIVYLSLYVIRSVSWTPGPWTRTLMPMSLAILGATTAKDGLKWLFGRPWPDSWVEHGMYGFHPFAESTLYGGFPSGHTSYIAAPMCLLCWLAPRYRALWMGIVAIVMIGLVGAGYHFVGDVVAGFFVGLAAAGAVVSVQSPVSSRQTDGAGSRQS